MHVLRRIMNCGILTDQQFIYSPATTVDYHKRGGQEFALHADYLAEMVRQDMYERYQEDAYNQGFKVYTTIRQIDQAAAYAALRDDVEDYDERHGYRGPEGYIDLHKNNTEEAMEEALQDVDDSNNLIPAIVQVIDRKNIRAYCRGGQVIEINIEKQTLARQALGNNVGSNQR